MKCSKLVVATSFNKIDLGMPGLIRLTDCCIEQACSKPVYFSKGLLLGYPNIYVWLPVSMSAV